MKEQNSKKLVEAIDIPKVIYVARKGIKKYLEKNLKSGQVLLIMGAGDIYNLNKEL